VKRRSKGTIFKVFGVEASTRVAAGEDATAPRAGTAAGIIGAIPDKKRCRTTQIQ
jgi:hypothetical protein